VAEGDDHSWLNEFHNGLMVCGGGSQSDFDCRDLVVVETREHRSAVFEELMEFPGWNAEVESSLNRCRSENDLAAWPGNEVARATVDDCPDSGFES
jgi:hypothetical protein